MPYNRESRFSTFLKTQKRLKIIVKNEVKNKIIIGMST